MPVNSNKMQSLENEIEKELSIILKGLSNEITGYFKSGGISINEVKRLASYMELQRFINEEIANMPVETVSATKKLFADIGKKLKLSDEAYMVVDSIVDANVAKLLSTSESIVATMTAAGIKYNMGQYTLNELASMLSDTIGGAGRSLRVEAMQGIMMYDRAVMYEGYKEAEVEKFYYLGPQDTKNRDICGGILNDPRQKTGWTMDDVQSSGADFISAGGFNCRHEWIPFEASK